MASAVSWWDARHAQHRDAIGRILAWEPQLRANEEASRSWRAGVEAAIARSEQRGETSVCARIPHIYERNRTLTRQHHVLIGCTLQQMQAAQTILDAGRIEMAEAVGKATASVRELEQQWPEWVTELREQQAALNTRKANAAEVRTCARTLALQ